METGIRFAYEWLCDSRVQLPALHVIESLDLSAEPRRTRHHRHDNSRRQRESQLSRCATVPQSQTISRYTILRRLTM